MPDITILPMLLVINKELVDPTIPFQVKQFWKHEIVLTNLSSTLTMKSRQRQMKGIFILTCLVHQWF